MILNLLIGLYIIRIYPFLAGGSYIQIDRLTYKLSFVSSRKTRNRIHVNVSRYCWFSAVLSTENISIGFHDFKHIAEALN